MNRKQYEYSNMFWEDDMWADDLPKEPKVDDEGFIHFIYLDDDELRDFMKIKMKENPEVLRTIRSEKFKSLLNEN